MVESNSRRERGQCRLKTSSEGSTKRLTFENRAQVPHGDATLAHVLADADLEEENRHAARHQADEVRNQERT